MGDALGPYKSLHQKGPMTVKELAAAWTITMLGLLCFALDALDAPTCPITLVVTTTGELHAENETRMLSWHVAESRDQTSAVMVSLAAHAAGAVPAPPDLAVWHDFQRWLEPTLHSHRRRGHLTSGRRTGPAGRSSNAASFDPRHLENRIFG
jgi:hypothetical protein